MQVDLQRAKHLVREAARLQPGRPALRIGLRAALAVVAPMLVASRIEPLVMTWATSTSSWRSSPRRRRAPRPRGEEARSGAQRCAGR
ncbi:MAG TPA: hypothetical protein VFT22_22795, partial [Kofleriaceae bacterium]|nr:hypothetical protein [Kofleriaceae bacterium]